MGSIQRLLMALWVLALVGCSSRDYQAPLFERTESTQRQAELAARGQVKPGHLPASYTVKRGDTLYSIAWRFHLNYKTLASWNGVAAPYTIYVSQQLSFNAPKRTLRVASVPVSKPISKPTNPPVKPTTTKTPKVAVVKPSVTPKQVPVVSRPMVKKGSNKVRWAWPMDGKLISRFSTRNDRAGIRLQGKPGQAVKAAADGVVVFSSPGIVGYPNLIIVEHRGDYLSAYAYSAKRLVDEGDKVKRGQKIALLSVNRLQKPQLHFEIRLKGNAVNPIKYLSKK